jgi:predicted alpha/beta-hydrolase family hydrolase
MRGWAKRLRKLGKVSSFDYPYMRQGRKRPDRHEKLLAAHLQHIDRAHKRHDGPLLLAGKSMGGRIGCHAALERDVSALMCLGYPLVSPSGSVRDEVLLALRTPVLFVQGTRDPLCPLDRLAKVRRRMKAPHALHVVDSGDHSLRATKTWLRDHDQTQADVDARAAAAIASFMEEQLA